MKIAGVHVKPWMIAAGAVAVLWYLNRPKAGATQGATGTATGAAAGLDAGRHHGGGHRGGRHFRGIAGPAAPSWTFVGTGYAPSCYCENCNCAPQGV